MNLDKLPQNVINGLKDWYIIPNIPYSVEVFEDPKVNGTYALRVIQENYTFDLLWYNNGFDEVEFTEWPPISKDLKFSFI